MQPTRRQVLAGAAVALSAACTDHPAAHRSAPDPDVAVTAAAVAREQALLAAYDEVLALVPALRPELAPYRADHASHLAALSPTATSSPTPAVLPPRAVRPTPALARARLAAVERAAATGHAKGALAASTRLAGLLASLSACEAAHASLL